MSMWIPAVIVLIGLLASLAVVIRRDGLGHRPPPASHSGWFDQSELRP